jgi:TPR repeat protein
MKARAEQGGAVAQSYLGIMYSMGDGVAQNDIEAVKWARLAAEQGFAGAQYLLGVMYANGEGVTQSDLKAYVWCSVAAAQGHAEAAEARDGSRDQLSQSALEQAQALAARCLESGFKACD